MGVITPRGMHDMHGVMHIYMIHEMKGACIAPRMLAWLWISVKPDMHECHHVDLDFLICLHPQNMLRIVI